MEKGADAWLLLTQYSQKYNVSVSTLRRRIRDGKIAHKLTDGKYYVQDTAPMGMLPQTTGGPSENNMNNLSDVLAFCKELIQSKEILFKETLSEKMNEIAQLKERLSEQKMLIQILEEKMAKRPNPKAQTLDH
jgi:predicted RNase H-like nuclease (RuvC/YqgF family)